MSIENILTFNPDRGIGNLVVSIKNESSVTIPQFKLRFYKDDPAKNLDEAGNLHRGWHNAGPVEPGNQWNERTGDFHLPDGEHKFSVVLDYDNAIPETNENNNTTSIKVVVKDGVRVKKDLDHGNLPDPVSDVCKSLQQQINELKAELEQLKQEGSRENAHSNL